MSKKIVSICIFLSVGFKLYAMEHGKGKKLAKTKPLPRFGRNSPFKGLKPTDSLDHVSEALKEGKKQGLEGKAMSIQIAIGCLPHIEHSLRKQVPFKDLEPVAKIDLISTLLKKANKQEPIDNKTAAWLAAECLSQVKLDLQKKLKSPNPEATNETTLKTSSQGPKRKSKEKGE